MLTISHKAAISVLTGALVIVSGAAVTTTSSERLPQVVPGNASSTASKPFLQTVMMRFIRANSLEDSRKVRARLPDMNRRERAVAGLGTLAPNLIVIPCLLKTQSPYLRRTYGYTAIGTKAGVSCQMLVDRIELETWMEHQRFGFWIPPHRGSSRGQPRPGGLSRQTFGLSARAVNPRIGERSVLPK